MVAAIFSKSDPLTVLLNEIDILLAQTRLLELYVKRAQTASRDRLAQLHEQHQQELSAVKAELLERKRAQAASEAALGMQTELQQRVELLSQQLTVERRAVETKTAELLQAQADAKRLREQTLDLEVAYAAAKAESLALQSSGRVQAEAGAIEQPSELQAPFAAEELGSAWQRILQLEGSNNELSETARQLRAELRGQAAEVKALQHKIAVQERELTGRYQALSAVELALHAKIQGLQQALAGSRRDIDEREQALAEAQYRIGELRRQLEAASAARNTAESALAQIQSRVENLSRQLEEVRHSQSSAGAFKAISKEEFHIMKTGDSNAQGTDLTGTPDDPSVTGSEQRLREELTRLRREAQEKNQILQDRNDELVRVKAQLDQVQERLAQLDLPAAQEAAGDSDADRMRTEFQAQLALLQAELSQKEWALEEHQARAHALEQQLRREIEILRRRIHDQSSERGRALGGESGDPGGEESIAANGDPCNDEGSILFAGHRRWNPGFGRKRRWRF